MNGESDRDLGSEASQAFENPSALANRRLGKRHLNRALSPNSDCSSVARSRRSVSMIQTKEDAEIFGQMQASTGVHFSKKVKPQTPKSNAYNVDDFMSGVNSATNALMKRWSPRDSKAQDHPLQDERGLSDFAESFDDANSKTAPHRMSSGDVMSVASSRRTPLDLHNNDNSFHVMANLLVEFLESKLSEDRQTIVLNPDDRTRMERVLPESIRLDFIDAVRYRISIAPPEPVTPLDFLTVQCQELGMDREGRENPIFVAANLQDKPSYIPVSPILQAISNDVKERNDVQDGNDSDEEYEMIGESSVMQRLDEARSRRSADSKQGSGIDPEASDDRASIKTDALAEKYQSMHTDCGALPDHLTALGAKINDSKAIADAAVAEFQRNALRQLQVQTKVSDSGSNCSASPRSPPPDAPMDKDDEDDNQAYWKQPVKPTANFHSAGVPKLFRKEPASDSERSDRYTGKLKEDATGWPSPVSKRQKEREETTSPIFNINPFSALGTVGNPFFSVGGFGFAGSSDKYDELERQKRDIAIKAKESTDQQSFTDSSRGSKSTGEIRGGSNPEALARQQLLAELREATNLMQESENSETAQFWKDHVIDLQNRIRILNGEASSVDANTDSALAESNRQLVSEFQQRESFFPPEQPHLAAPSGRIGAASILASAKSFPAMVSGLGFFGTGAAQPTTHGAQQLHSNGNNPTPEQAVPVMGGVQNLPSPITNTNVKTETSKEPNYDQPMVDVIAPADLPGGHQFEAEIEGKRFLATVPQGGVQQGEVFTCYMRELDSVAIDIPVGRWRDGLGSFCDYGCCHPVVWNSIFCPLRKYFPFLLFSALLVCISSYTLYFLHSFVVALGQVQTRVGFDYLGGQASLGPDGQPLQKITNRAVMSLMILSWLSMNGLVYLSYTWKWDQAMELTMADLGALGVVNVAMYIFIVFVAQATRGGLREKFMIREQRCSDLEDITVAGVCLPCTVSQMMRHTGNYDDYEGVCCSKTGLPDGVRVNQINLLSKGDGQYVV